MGFNETLLLITAVFSAGFVVLSWKLGKERLYSAIMIFLLLISAVGGKIVEFFGFATNTGNVFYASVFLGTYFLIERYGKGEGIRSIWIGAMGVAFFLVLVQITVALQGSATTRPLNEALSLAYDPTTRIAFASLLAYTLSQSLNVHLYIYLKQKWAGTYLWLRANVVNVFGQILDSTVFFTVAFWGVVPPQNVTEVLITGFAIKVFFMMLAAPLLYLNRLEEDDDEKGFSAVVVH